MLQIITGRFFKGTERHRTPGKGIIYSNYSWVLPIVTPVGTLDPVDRFGAVPAYVYSFECQLEKVEGEPKAGTLIATGEDEIVRQFQLLLMFGFQAYFASDRGAVLTNCRQRAIGSHERYVPARFVDRILSEQLRPTKDEIDGFLPLLDKVLRLPREKYVALIDVLDTFERALEALNGSLDLAYSMVVYCLESLSQRFDKYEPRWPDHELSGKMDKLLAKAPDVAAEIRSLMVSSSHLKLTERFLHFVEDHIGDDFFTDRARGRSGAIRRSQLRRALRNAYKLRSGYVHRLQPIREQLHHPTIGEWEVFTWDGEPYLTFRGLTNVLMRVLRTFVARGESLDAEDGVNWRADLPGIMRFKWAPEAWISLHKGLADLSEQERAVNVRDRFDGLLQVVVGFALSGEPAKVDLRKVLAFYEDVLPHAKKDARPAMLATHVLFNRLVGEDAMPTAERVRNSNARELERRVIEYVAIELLLHDRILGGTYEELVKLYETYSQERYAANAVTLPSQLEIKFLCVLANMALEAGKHSDYRRFLEIAIGEAAGDAATQERLATALAEGASIDHRALLTISRRNNDKADEPQPSAANANPPAHELGQPGDLPTSTTRAEPSAGEGATRSE